MTYFLLCISLLCVGCSFRCKEMVAFDRVTSRVERVLAKEEGLQVFGIGTLGPGYFKGIDLSYVSPEKVNRDQGRRIFLRTVDTIIKVVNEDADFTQYMKPPPFTSDQLLFGIIFNHDDTDRYIEMVMMVHNKISYYLMKSEFESTKIGTETLEGAMRIVEAEGMQLNNLKKYIDKQANEEENPAF
jgi:hypothetical protein